MLHRNDSRCAIGFVLLATLLGFCAPDRTVAEELAIAGDEVSGEELGAADKGWIGYAYNQIKRFKYGFDSPTQYFFRGIFQEDQGLIFQPWGELAINVHESDGSIQLRRLHPRTLEQLAHRPDWQGRSGHLLRG